MADALSLIKDAMYDLGQLYAGQTPDSSTQTDVLNRLNKMLDSWSTSSLLVPFRTQVSHTLDGSQSYTIGSTGDISATRPTYIDSAYVADSDTDYPIKVLRSRAAYDRITDKTITGAPNLIYYEPTLGDGTIYVWYVGDSSYTLYLNTRGQLTSFPDTSTDVDLAPGYYEAIYSNLAVNIAPMFEASVSQELALKAQRSMTRIKRLNRQVPTMQLDPAIPTRQAYNIETG